MKHIIGLLAMLLPILSAAQESPGRELTIGDSIPEMPYISIINHSDSTAALNDFSNELIIIDFWSTWCVPCVKALPDLQELQKQFGNRVRFLLTTPQDKPTIKEFLQKKKITLPCFVDDKVLSEYFPHNSVPHEVWIHKGKIIAITYAEEVTAANIQNVLDGKSVDFTLKKANFDYDIDKPLLLEGNGGSTDDLLYHSVITGYLDGLPGGGGVSSNGINKFKLLAINASVTRLYSTAAQYQNIAFSLDNRLIIETQNQERFKPSGKPEYTPSLRDLFYCYELIIPDTSVTKASNFMLDDLNRYFNVVYQIGGFIENRKVLCWIMRKSDTPVTIYTKSSKRSVTSDAGYEIWSNMPFSSFFEALAFVHREQPHPFIDETGITENVDVKFPIQSKDVPTLASYLKKFGLNMFLEEREIPMLVIKNNLN